VKTVIAGILWLSGSIVGWGAADSSESVRHSAPLRTVPNVAFGVGEELYFKIRYGFVTAGKAAFKVLPQLVPCDSGRQCYDIRFYFQATFDHYQRLVYVRDTAYQIPPFVHDVVSAFFYVRTLPLDTMRAGDTLYLQNFYKDRVYDLKVVVRGREIVDVDAGRFRTILIEPLVQEGGLFKSEGSILIWLSDDERKIPVQVATEVLIGSIYAELVGYRGLRGPVTAKIAK